MSLFDPRARQEDTAARIALALHRIGQATHLMIRRAGQAHGLSPAQVHALLFMAYGRPGARTISGLAQRLQCTPATASGVMDALERKGLARRAPHPEEGRVVTLHLTAAGAALVQELEHALAPLEEIVRELPAAGQADLLEATQQVVRRLAEGGYVVVYEMCWGCRFFRPNAHPEDPARPHHCAFMDAPLPVEDTYTECPDFVPAGQG